MLIQDNTACKELIGSSALADETTHPMRGLPRRLAEGTWAASWYSAMAVLGTWRQGVFAASVSRERRALGSLDARLLDDIGVSAQDAAREAGRGWSDLPGSR